MINAIITLYNPDNQVKKNVEKISVQADRTFLVDNSITCNEKLFANMKNIIYINMGFNSGLPIAYNTVLKNPAYQWGEEDVVIFFDQDSSICDDQILELNMTFNELSVKYKIGVIGAAYKNTDGEFEIPHIKQRVSGNCYKVQDIITSSMTTKYKILKDVGFWNEALFLDGADWDLCWRLRDKGYVCILKIGMDFRHTVGKGNKRIICFRMIDSMPIRSYYRTRDNLYLLMRSYTPRYLKFRLAVDLLFVNLLRILFLDGRMMRIKYIIRGCRDFNNKIYGEFNK